MSIWTILFVVLLIAWIGGFSVFHVAGGLIHLLLVFAVIIPHSAFRDGTKGSLKIQGPFLPGLNTLTRLCPRRHPGLSSCGVAGS